MTPATKHRLRTRAEALRDYSSGDICEAIADALDHLATHGEVCAADIDAWPEHTARRAVARVRGAEDLVRRGWRGRAPVWGRR